MLLLINTVSLYIDIFTNLMYLIDDMRFYHKKRYSYIYYHLYQDLVLLFSIFVSLTYMSICTIPTKLI